MSTPICAIATPLGHSAVGVIRTSGEGTLALVEKIFCPLSSRYLPLEKFPRQAILGHIVADQQVIDEVLLLPFAKGSSYTSEESAEIHCHGNPVILRKIMESLLAIGFSPARPGEFTKRAFLAGRLDLTQAEAVREIIEARSEKELQNALFLKRGGFRNRLLAFRSQLMNMTADMAAELDFVDEDIEFVSVQQKVQILQDTINEISQLLAQAGETELLRHGLDIAIIGAPNAGKSSLLNYLSGKERALVSEIPGTTRDFLESTLQINGVPVNFIDTAGIREHTTDQIEKMGIAASLEKAREADIRLLMLDGSQNPQTALAQSPLEKLKSENLSQNLLVLVNKQDILHPDWQNLPGSLLTAPVFFISLGQKTGLEPFRAHLDELVASFFPHTDAIMLSAWQKERMEKIHMELANCLELTLKREPQEILLSSLQLALELLAEISGEITSEDILGRIFSRFCIGK